MIESVRKWLEVTDMGKRKSTGLTLQYIGESLGFGTKAQYDSRMATVKAGLAQTAQAAPKANQTTTQSHPAQ
ncbi:MAG: hypothetical protein HC933_00865 [Pleurocapsa sp. SU_196_0]|nr:hypothetical protein [Pleurocapsa sp. SU_196_0]